MDTQTPIWRDAWGVARAVLYYLILVVGLVSCDRNSPTPARFAQIPIPPIESQHFGNMYWISDEELSFPVNADGPSQVLNVATGGMRRTDGGELNSWYFGCKSGAPVYQANPYSKVELEPILRALQASPCAIARFPPSTDQAVYWASLSLLADHGFVTLPRQGDAVLHQPGGPVVAIAGLDSARLVGASNNFKYYAFKRAYLIHNTRPREIGWLYPSGKIEIVPLKSAIDFRGNSYIHATQAGFVQVSNEWRASRFVFLTTDKAVDIESGDVAPVVISPDGCKIAYGLLTSNNARALRVLSVCGALGRPGEPIRSQ